MRRLPVEGTGQAERFDVVASNPEKGYQRPNSTVQVDTNKHHNRLCRVYMSCDSPT